MFNSKFNTLLTVLLIVAIIAIIGLMGYFGYSVFNKYNIETGAKDAVDAFENTTIKKPIQNTIEEPNANDIVIGGVSEEPKPTDQNQSGGRTQYHGYDVLGTISIPAIKIEYPILAKVTTQSLKLAVVYLRGARNKSSR